MPHSCLVQNKPADCQTVKKGQRQKKPFLSLWEVQNNPTANILEQWLATVSQACLCDDSLMCHYSLFPTWINECSPHQTTPTPHPPSPLNLRGKVTPAVFFLVQRIPQHLLFEFHRHMSSSYPPPTLLCGRCSHCNSIGRAVLRVSKVFETKPSRCLILGLGLGLVSGNDRSPRPFDLCSPEETRLFTFLFSVSVRKTSFNQQNVNAT